MGTTDEMILAMDREYLFKSELLTFQGLLTNPREVKRITKRFNKYTEVRRGDAENDLTLKQIIPYVVVRRGDDIFVYKRLKGSGETRLHDSLSIGVGGHMNPVDHVNDWDELLEINVFRELHEELDIRANCVVGPRVIGLINNDDDDTGLFHIGILMVMELPEHAEVTVRETDKLEGYWLRSKDLRKAGLFEALEGWSQIIAGVL